ncbi:unnamed protein product [Periconia digitata]|uniref:tyrosinase n=1 Tax=Periconia digitata TaxID=1303443 RepID=A0A9W4XWD3_9PLEO|nr:unnamed protein product [Periconia digitata]
MVGIHSFGALAAVASTFTSVSLASPLTSESAAANGIVKRQNGFFVVHPIEDGGVQPRLNIRDLAGKSENKELWALYILAIKRLQAVDQKEKLSYYQVAGIHGQPWIPWDGVPSWTDDPHWGYCPHNGNLFATWHRPYVMLYEQLLYEHVKAIVGEISDATTKARFQEIAKKFRVPYWDWAQKIPAVAAVSNPLSGYRFHPLQPEDFPVPENFQAPYDHWEQIIHYPDDPSSTNPNDNLTGLHQTLNNNLGFARDGIYKLFTNYLPFNRFSNQGPGSDVNIGNLETVHGSIHDSFRDGHLQFPLTAAFDPIFYLHHANVDRQIAIWQAIYPDTFVEPVRAIRQSTFTLDAFAADPVGATTPLHPFHKNSQGDFWTSDDVRQISTLGYTYPELADTPSNDTLKARVKALYEDTRTRTLTRRQTDAAEKTSRNYNVRVSQPDGFATYLFLGEPGPDPETWRADSVFAGSFSTKFNIIADPDREEIKKNPVNGVVPITSSIVRALDAGMLQDADETAVVEYLKINLKWKIQTTDGKEISPDQVPNFNISIFSHKETVPASAGEFPAILETKEYPDITAV